VTRPYEGTGVSVSTSLAELQKILIVGGPMFAALPAAREG
jgi:hypothetical protein